MTKLERHCRALMLAYPAGYRRDRTDEMVGTLLETTPPGRDWPLPRDARALLAGGLRARTVSNRRLTLRTNLRTSVCAGVAAYLGFTALRILGLLGRAAITGGWAWEVRFYGWPYLVAFALMALAVVLAVAGGRRALILAGALPAAGLLCYAEAGSVLQTIARVATPVTCLAILVALSGRDARLAQRSLWPVGVAVLSSLLLLGFMWNPDLFEALLLAVGAISLARIPLDARPAIALCVLVLIYWLPVALNASSAGRSLALIPPAITLAIAALAAWRLRSQSVNAARQRI